jgi:hypothetical protein
MAGTQIRRASLPLTERDVADLATLRGSAAELAALESLVNVDLTNSSEAKVLHAVLEAGLRAVREHVDEHGYAALAEEQRATREQRQAVARRRRPQWAAEE